MAGLHIYYGIVLRRENRQARGDRYAVTSYLASTFASRMMIWSGTAIGLFLIYLLMHFTFQVISYLVDVWRGDIRACTSKNEFFLYVAFFPQLVAGQIFRANDFLPQLQPHFGVNRAYV